MQGTDRGGERVRRRAARETVAAYHEQQLTLLLDRVRDGFARMDARELDAFDVDELIHRYQRAARELWKFCGSSGASWERAAGGAGADQAWDALDITTIKDATVRLHWTDQPYTWHVNDGPEVFVVLDGAVDMHYRQAGGEHVAHPAPRARILVVERNGSI